MGVVYKLTPEISSSIIEHKRSNPRVSCQDLAEMVLTKFGQKISKSSVHELLKNAQVIQPKAYRPKQKFQIPPEKKAQLFPVSLPKAEQDLSPPSDMAVGGMGEVFLKCAFYDLSFKPILGLKDYEDMASLNSKRLWMDWEYLTTPVESFKVDLEDGSYFYIDARFQGLYDENPSGKSMTAPVERAIAEMSDCLFNNIRPLLIRNIGGQLNSTVPLSLQNFISSFENSPGKTIHKISLVAAKDRILTEFNQPLKMKRYFILATPSTADVKEVRVVKNQNRTLLTNLNPDSCDVWGMYLNRHPSHNCQLSAMSCQLGEDMTNQPQWLKNRLKERSITFFPPDMPLSALDEILSLPGKPSSTPGVEEVHLQPPDGFPYLAQVQKSAENVNNLDIVNNKKEKVRIFVE